MARRATYVRAAKVLGVVALMTGIALGAAQSGILFPEWSEPTAGSYGNPASQMGKKASEQRPWSLETVASSIEGEPLEGKPLTAVGEIIDLSCYLQVGKHGDKHRDCGQKCVANGQPVGLLTADGSVYMLIDEEHNARRDGLTEFRKQAIENMAHVVTVHGTLSEVAGQKAIFVQGYIKRS